MQSMKRYGLLGKTLKHSFSKDFFEKKFEREQLECSYENFEINDISHLDEILNSQNDLQGFNVTIPYKEQIIPFLDELSEEAKVIGAVNTVKIIEKDGNKKLVGYNTDAHGFSKSLKPFLTLHHQKALVLGTGGASKAVVYSLMKLGIDVIQVSRDRNKSPITYSELSGELLKHYLLIVNTTPLGMYPDSDSFPDIPYHGITKEHLLYDLVYNPEETLFLKKGKEQGAETMNGKQMLVLQAEKAWEIWNEK